MIVINYKDKRPIYEQIIDQFERLILTNVLKIDEAIPSVRNLSKDLSINPNTIQRAYQELEKEGFIYTIKGRGSFVCKEEKAISHFKQQWKDDLKKLIKEGLVIKLTKKEIYDVIDEFFK
ncbi:MAG: GntR family transcriptional regulator [Eubacteriales bacterium]|nr:GntR family transcriptional regulator [Eubacteriales bacterium]